MGAEIDRGVKVRWLGAEIDAVCVYVKSRWWGWLGDRSGVKWGGGWKWR